jgi:hypothetical protein
MALNKFQDVGISLGTIADFIREKGASPIERDYHAVFVRMIGILEQHEATINEAKQKIDALEDDVAALKK